MRELGSKVSKYRRRCLGDQLEAVKRVSVRTYCMNRSLWPAVVFASKCDLIRWNLVQGQSHFCINNHGVDVLGQTLHASLDVAFDDRLFSQPKIHR